MNASRESSRRALRARLLVTAIAIALSAPVVAQDETREEEESAGTLEVVTVTAQRRVEDVQEVPVSITTVETEKLDIIGSGGEDIRFLAGRLPSLNIESSFGRAFPRFYIRGLGNTDFDLNASQPVSLVYDDIVQENPILKGFPVFDVEQVEMLRGPQGTLFGRNTPAGVVKFDSRRPSQVPEGYFQASYGKYGTTNLEGAANAALGESWSMRFSGLYQHRDDWVDNTFTGEDDALEGYNERAARLQFLYAPNDDFDALFNVHARSLDGTARLFRANIIREGSNDFVPGFDRERIAIDGRNFQELDTWGANARLRWDFDRVSFFSITGYESADTLSRGDIDGGFGAVFAPPFGPGFIPFPAESADGLPDHSQFTQEFRVESNEWGDFDWQAGFYWFDEDITIDSFNYDTLAPGRPQNGYARQEQQNEAWAVYASGEYDVSSAFKLRGGVRYTRDEKEFVAQRFQSPLAFLGVGPIGPLRANPSDSDVSWDLSAVWSVNDDVNVYGRVARGFRAPSIQGRLLFGDVVSVADSETVISYEAGVKADLWDRRARLGFSVFTYTVDNQQLTAVGGATNFNTLVNVDETNGHGFEVDFEAYVTENFLVTLGGSYNDTEIDDEDLAIQPCGGGCTVLDPDGPIDGTVLIDGNSLPQAPEWVWNVTARWGTPVGPGELYVYTDWAYRDEVNFFLYESAEFKGDSLLEGGLRVGYTWNDGQYDLALFGRNITDEEELVGGIDFNNLTGFVNEPRIWGVEFAVRW
jgi:iron complex outermembrane recepter protein